MEGKTAIYKVAKNLKKHNRTKRGMKHCSPYVFITNHLQRAFQEQRKKLLRALKARTDKQKTNWLIENGECCLFVDNKRVNLNNTLIVQKFVKVQ